MPVHLSYQNQEGMKQVSRQTKNRALRNGVLRDLRRVVFDERHLLLNDKEMGLFFSIVGKATDHLIEKQQDFRLPEIGRFRFRTEKAIEIKLPLFVDKFEIKKVGLFGNMDYQGPELIRPKTKRKNHGTGNDASENECSP